MATSLATSRDALRHRMARFGRAAWTAGVLWPLGAAAILIVAAWQTWIGVPLMMRATAWDLPVNFGWGWQASWFSYGLVLLLVALVLLARAALAWPGLPARWARPLSPRALIWLGLLCLGVPLMLLWQTTMADLPLMAQLAANENQSLLIQKHLAYHLQAQHIPMLPFQVDVSSIAARATLLYQLAGAGTYLVLLAALVCAYGAYAMRQTGAPAVVTAGQPAHRWRPLWWAMGGVVALVIFGRAPLGLWYEQLGQNSLTTGNYAAALQQFATAQALNPNLTALPSFHQERGAALFHLQRSNDPDIGLFLSAQFRATGALELAWRQDQSLLSQYGPTSAIVQESVTTLELLAERDSSNGLSHAQITALARYPLAAVPDVAQVLPQLALAQTRLTDLLALQPTNIYAHYLKGFILFANHDYAAASQDFLAIQPFTSDRNMQSIAMTYLAFCHAGVGDYAGERSLLQKAMEFDNGYYNTLAREAASGLH